MNTEVIPNRVDKLLKRYVIDKYVGMVVVIISTLGAIDTIVRFGDVIGAVFLIVFALLGLMMWLPSNFNTINTYTIYKMDLSLWVLLKKTNYKISSDHCYQILKNVNIALNYKFLPLIEENKDQNYMPFLQKLINDRYMMISCPIDKDDVTWVEVYLPKSESFLTPKERQLLDQKLSFYSYEEK